MTTTNAAIDELGLTTKSLIRNHQLVDILDERKTLEDKMRSKHVQDKGEVAKQIKRLDTSLQDQRPKPFTGKDVDKAIKLEEQLRNEILEGMPSQEEMRCNPPGAVDKHMRWEGRSKAKLLIWKQLKQRMEPKNTDRDLCNFEKYRPTSNTLNMDGAQIKRSTTFFPPEGAGSSVTFSDAQIALLNTLAPDVGAKLALLSNEQRGKIKKLLDQPAETHAEDQPEVKATAI